MNRSRRTVVKAGLGATALFAPLPWAWVWGQEHGDVAPELLRAPKMALVVGNGRYENAPKLRNSPNDARAIAESLKSLGFAVTLLLDAGKVQFIGGVRDHVQAVEKRKAVGLFYYAGHGVQLAWRNYMVPIDASIEKLEDIAKQSVDIERLMEGLTKASNPMNVIILDACRENPFSSDFRVEHKGLSQMDAPLNTLLAYATSPGNVASDGDGANGLYTKYLLREMKVPEAKIEDVFKRVRLGVRRESNGAQIPWESTSLEEDFWFIPPNAAGKRSEEKQQSAFDEQLQAWESVRGLRNVQALESYLRRYPNGHYSELAQLELDAALRDAGERRIEVAPQAGNPYSQGFARADTNFKVGDFYKYRVTDLATGAVKRIVPGVITSITADEVVIGEGAFVMDRMGNTRRTAEGLRFTDHQDMPVEFYVGKKWSSHYRAFLPNVPESVRVMTQSEYRIVGKEKVTVPAGTFECFRVEGRGTSIGPNGRAELTLVIWWAPEKLRRFLAHEMTRTGSTGSNQERLELIEFKQT